MSAANGMTTRSSPSFERLYRRHLRRREELLSARGVKRVKLPPLLVRMLQLMLREQPEYIPRVRRQRSQHLRDVRRLQVIRRERRRPLPHPVEPRSLSFRPQQRRVDVVHARDDVHPRHRRELAEERLRLRVSQRRAVDVVQHDVEPPRRALDDEVAGGGGGADDGQAGVRAPAARGSRARDALLR
eukprot:29015-Pelagococcus_subviridis.AAC.4